MTATPAQKRVSAVCAVLLALLFFASGVWKLTDSLTWSQMLGQFQVPAALTMPGTLLLGIGETLSALLILVPRFRRWGALLIALMLVVFMGYIGANYSTLVGKDCSCFPLVKRSVGPGFFVGDGIMLLMAVLAGVWAQRASGLRMAFALLAAVTVFAGGAYAYTEAHNSGIRAPSRITVDGKPHSLEAGRQFLFFYDPECMHCDAASRRMSKLHWKDTTVVAIPTRVPQFAASFLHDTGLQAGTSLDNDLLRKTFKFVDPPYGVLLEGGRQRSAVSNFTDDEPTKTLKAAGWVE